MTATRRLAKQLSEIREAKLDTFRITAIDESNVLVWQCLVIPEHEPYNQGAFKIEINFPVEYPFKPPKIVFKTLIYHPSVDDRGQVLLPFISAEKWKPATKIKQVIHALITLIHDPKPEQMIRVDLAEEYARDRKTFMKNAKRHTKRHAEKRPAEEEAD